MTEQAQLCRACGFCCDGTLFDHAPLQRQELPSARRGPLRIVTLADESHALAQPCPARGETGCVVYEHRPVACRRFDCRLVRSLEEDEVSLPEALSLVRQVRRSPQPDSLLRLYFHRPSR